MNAFWFSWEKGRRNGVSTVGWPLLGRCKAQQWKCIPTWLGPAPSTVLHRSADPEAGAGPQHRAHCLHQPPASSCWAQKFTQLFKRVLQSTFRGVWCQAVPHSPALRWNTSPPCSLLCAEQKVLRALHFTGAVKSNPWDILLC